MSFEVRRFWVQSVLGLSFIAFLTFAATPVLAQESANSSQSQAASRDLGDDNWFFYIGTGFGRPAYDGETQRLIDLQKARGGESPQAGYFDLPGIYRKFRPGFAVGGVAHWTFENVARKWGENDSFAVQTYNVAVSTLYFPGDVMGLGWFGRADLGSTRIYQRREYPSSPGSRVEESNRDGVFGQIALGYGWRASSFARVLVHANAHAAAAGPNQMNGFSLNLGFLL